MSKKNILVTGSSRGISLSIALKLAAQGNKVIINGRNRKTLKKNKKQVKKLIRETVPLNRFASTTEIADLASYLISDKAKFANGAIFTIDGGQTI
jgi:3-oxoacyl-[acyl-carrier protein] reductase